MQARVVPNFRLTLSLRLLAHGALCVRLSVCRAGTIRYSEFVNLMLIEEKILSEPVECESLIVTH